jgi:hypothetical protein
MDELDFTADIAALRSTFADIRSVIGVDRLKADIAELSEQAGAPDLWDDTEKAQKVTSALSHRQSELARIDSIQSRLDDLEVMVELANSESDEDAAAEARTELAAITAQLGDLEVQTLLNGEFDDHPAVITIRAGAGGVDASDFADMLFRMYVRWAEQHKYPVTIMDTSYAEEAGGCPIRVRHPERRGRNAPTRSHEPLQLGGQAPDQLCRRRGDSAHRVSGRDRHSRGRHPSRCVSLERTGRPVGQHHGLCRATHPPSHRHRGLDA